MEPPTAMSDAPTPCPSKRSQPTIVVVTMFQPECGHGEFSGIASALDLEPLDLQHLGIGRAGISADGRILAVVAGVGTANTACALTALGYANEFNLASAHWLVAGIAGGNPNRVDIGDLVVADWLVDGDLAFEIDEREIPDDWTTGILPLGSSRPYEAVPDITGKFGQPYQVFELGEPWGLDELRSLQNCRVHRGAVLSAARFWHGSRLNDWAECWTRFWTAGQSEFLAASMEDTGTALALRTLELASRAQFGRLTLIRAISNLTVRPDAPSAAASLENEAAGDDYPGFERALEILTNATTRMCKALLSSQRPAGA